MATRARSACADDAIGLHYGPQAPPPPLDIRASPRACASSRRTLVGFPAWSPCTRRHVAGIARRQRYHLRAAAPPIAGAMTAQNRSRCRRELEEDSCAYNAHAAAGVERAPRLAAPRARRPAPSRRRNFADTTFLQHAYKMAKIFLGSRR